MGRVIFRDSVDGETGPRFGASISRDMRMPRRPYAAIRK